MEINVLPSVEVEAQGPFSRLGDLGVAAGLDPGCRLDSPVEQCRGKLAFETRIVHGIGMAVTLRSHSRVHGPCLRGLPRAIISDKELDVIGGQAVVGKPVRSGPSPS